MSHPVYNPAIPYAGQIPGGFSHGRVIRIQGSIYPNANRFTINVMCGPSSTFDDIGLHLSVKLNENSVSCNTRALLNWGPEERKVHIPFSKGGPFEVLILCERQEYKIAFNGHHFTGFEHRIPVTRMTHVSVEGDVSVSLIQFEGSSGMTPSAPPPMMPMAGSIPPPYPMGQSMPQPIIGWAAESNSYPPSGPPPYQAPPPGYSAYPPGQNYPPQPGYPPPQGPYGGYEQAQHQQSGKSGGSSIDKAGKMVAGQLEKAGFGSLASKIPGGSQKHKEQPGHYPQGAYPTQGYQPQGAYPQSGYPQGPPPDPKSGHSTGALVGTAAAAGVGGIVAAKALKKGKKKKKIIKYGVPIAGVALGAYAVKKILD